MAPERQVVTPGRAHAPRELPRSHQSDVGGWPLPARVVRQIQREVARAGRSLQRLEVRGAVIDNFDALGPPSPPSPATCRTPEYFTSGEAYQEDSMETDSKVKTDPEDGTGEDNDLTNLTWLQDSNLLRSMHFNKTENDELRPISAQSVKSEPSPTSDYQEESVTWEQADSSGSELPPASPPRTPTRHPHDSSSEYHTPNKTNGAASKVKHPHNIPYDPLIHTQNKPPYSFSCLIFMAIEDSPAKALPVKEIYAWIVTHFPYFRSAPAGWKNSVRHNLSLNKCFQKVEKAPSLGKGSLWMVDDQYRSNLLQAFSRSPFHPCVPPALPTPAPTPQDRLPSVASGRGPGPGPKGAPNPKLFPFLTRHLAASEPPETPTSEAISGHESCDSLDEVVAAAMVLALKHGPGVLPRSIVSSYANQDHTYSAATTSPEAGYASDEQRRTAEALLHLAGVNTTPQQTQVPHRPRLLRIPPKRSAPAPAPAQTPLSMDNNNHAGHLDQNLPHSKRPRHHSKHQ